MTHEDAYRLVTDAMLRTAKRWDGTKWYYSIDCAAAHRIAHLMVAQSEKS